MTIEEAASLIASPHIDGSVWADLGCGEGTFTLALATLLPQGSVIHAIDQDTTKLRRIPPKHAGCMIHKHAMDFTMPLPVASLDGVLLANAIHFVDDKLAFVRDVEASLVQQRFLIVEYDTETANPWVPYPLSRAAFVRLFRDAGYDTIEFLGSRHSVYRSAEIYGAIATSRSLDATS
jgi:ubiquinone/menaquinone biosynthesis C-methylase UbiE